MSKILYKELSYKIVGCAYGMYNQIGFGYREKHYQKILAEIFKENNLKFKKELYGKLVYNNKLIAKYYLDFLVEDKIVVELKIANDFYTKHINQIISYLKAEKIKLGLLVLITKNGIKIKRLANSRNLQK